MKKGQVTVFIIIAVLIIVVVGVFFFIGQNNQKVYDVEFDNVRSFVDGCVEETGINALNYVANRGGYFTIPELSTEEGIAYYSYEGENLVPLKENIEGVVSAINVLSLFILNHL